MDPVATEDDRLEMRLAVGALLALLALWLLLPLILPASETPRLDRRPDLLSAR